MEEFLKSLKKGDVFQTNRGWWVRILDVFPDKIEGVFGTDEVSVRGWLYRVAATRAVWNKKNGREMTKPEDPQEWLRLEPVL